jgi:ribosomal-protein-alanine N-acetyltransferase
MDVAFDVSNIFLETERLILRPWRMTDLDDFFEYASVPGVGEMAGWKCHELKETSERVLKSFIEGKEVFALVYKENNKVIGSLGIHQSWANEDERYQNLKQKEIGYVLSKDYWGRGLMVEAVKRVITYCFDECGIEALTVCHFSFNQQSKRVIEKCGITFVKQTQTYVKQLDQTYDSWKYILLKDSESIRP